MTVTLTAIRLRNGLWEGQMSAPAGPAQAVEAWHLDRRLDGVEVQPLPGQPGQYAVRLAVPPALLSDGVQTVLFRVGGAVLARLDLIAGAALDEDLRAEIALLRAELDLLKRAFQRHCAEAGG